MAANTFCTTASAAISAGSQLLTAPAARASPETARTSRTGFIPLRETTSRSERVTDSELPWVCMACGFPFRSWTSRSGLVAGCKRGTTSKASLPYRGPSSHRDPSEPEAQSSACGLWEVPLLEHWVGNTVLSPQALSLRCDQRHLRDVGLPATCRRAASPIDETLSDGISRWVSRWRVAICRLRTSWHAASPARRARTFRSGRYRPGVQGGC